MPELERKISELQIQVKESNLKHQGMLGALEGAKEVMSRIGQIVDKSAAEHNALLGILKYHKDKVANKLKNEAEKKNSDKKNA